MTKICCVSVASQARHVPARGAQAAARRIPQGLVHTKWWRLSTFHSTVVLSVTPTANVDFHLCSC